MIKGHPVSSLFYFQTKDNVPSILTTLLVFSKHVLHIFINLVGILNSFVFCYGLDGLGCEPWWGQDFSTPVQTSSKAHPPPLCTLGTGSPSQEWLWHGVDHPPPSRAKDKHEQSCTYISSLLPPIPCNELTILDAVQKVVSLIYFTCD